MESVPERGGGKHKDKQEKKRTRKEKLKESKEKQEAQEQVTNISHVMLKPTLVIVIPKEGQTTNTSLKLTQATLGDTRARCPLLMVFN